MTSRTERHRQIRVCYPFIGNNIGGSHISTLMLVLNLDRKSVEPVIVLHEEGDLANYIRRQGLEYELLEIPAFFTPPYRTLRNSVTIFIQTLRIARFIRRRRFDIVHANDVRIHFGWTLATRMAGARLIWHQRTGSFGRSRLKLFLALLSEKLVCISNYTASTLPSRLTPLIRIVANPFDTKFSEVDRSETRATILQQLALPQNTRIIGFFGNLVQQKRPAIFLQAAAKIKERHQGPFAFLIFGAERDDARAELTQLAGEIGVLNDVYFMAFRAPIEPWMSGCDLIISPGVGEGLGRTPVESMIVGTPIVAANSGGHCEVITHGKNGLLAVADDPEAFAEAALEILRNPAEAQNRAKFAQREAIEKYSIDRHVAEMTEIYADSLDGIRHANEQITPA